MRDLRQPYESEASQGAGAVADALERLEAAQARVAAQQEEFRREAKEFFVVLTRDVAALLGEERPLTAGAEEVSVRSSAVSSAAWETEIPKEPSAEAPKGRPVEATHAVHSDGDSNSDVGTVPERRKSVNLEVSLDRLEGSGGGNGLAGTRRASVWGPDVAGLLTGEGDLSRPSEVTRTSVFSKASNASPNFSDNSADGLPLLPEGWPRTLTSPHSEAFRARSHSSQSWSTRFGVCATATDLEAIQERQDTGCLTCLVIDPNSHFRMVHSILSLLILVYDLTAIPYMLAWDVQMEGTWYVMTWFTMVWWTTDIGIGCLTGFYSRGELQTQPRLVFLHYAKTWLFPDSMLALCDWLGMYFLLVHGGGSNDETSSVRVLRIAKLSRFMRVAACFRLIKVMRIFENFMDAYMTEAHRFALHMLSLLLGTLWVNHFISCLWFFSGRVAPTDTGDRWTDFAVDGAPFLESSPLYQYTTAFHWSVSQLTLGAVDIICRSSAERMFSIVGLLLGLLFGTTLVSTLSASMVDMHMAAQDRVQKLRVLRTFLRENSVDRKIACLVQEKVLERLNAKRSLLFHEVAVFNLLSAPLREELHTTIVFPQLRRHLLFRHWEAMGGYSDPAIKRFCHAAVHETLLQRQDELFIPGVAKGQAYCLERGSLSYIQDPDSSPVHHVRKDEVQKGQWFCEAPLWVHWLHVGTTMATSHSVVVVLKVELIQQVLKLPPRHLVRQMTLCYGYQFYKRLQRSRPPSAPWPTDLEVPDTDFADIFFCMDSQMQRTIGRASILQVQANRRNISLLGATNENKLSKLTTEVMNGKSLVMLAVEGELQRIVALSTIRLERDNGDIFAQIGKVDQGGVAPGCQLPGVKQAANELPDEAVERLLSKKLEPFAIKATKDRVERNVQIKESKEYGVRTKYLRTVCRMLVDGFTPENACVAEMEGQVAVQRSMSSAMSGHSFHRNFSGTTITAYYVKDDNSYTFYAWLAPQDFEFLGSSAGESTLSELLSHLEESLRAESVRSAADEDDSAAAAEDDGAAAAEEKGAANEGFPPDAPVLAI